MTLLSKKDTQEISSKGRMKDVIIGGQNFFDDPVKNEIRTYRSIEKNVTAQGESTQRVPYWITIP